MITVLLTGGLGNQMFQYAAARSLAVRLKKSVAIDLLSYNKESKSTSRKFELDVFDIEFKFVSILKNKLFYKSLSYFDKNQGFYRKLGYYCDKRTVMYSSDFEYINEDVTLYGYFQNENYFKSVESIIHQDFSFKKPLNGKNKMLAQQIQQTQSVALHVRRGDYLNNSNIFSICDVDYYKEAIDVVCKKVANPHFFVFSEDLEWVKENIDFRGYLFELVDWNKGFDSYIDMQLMSICKNNIIANSSFSWWGAWLNKNEEKIVIAPQKWFKKEFDYTQFPGYVPDNWLKV